MNAVAIIPARGGSKRIPRKNIKPFFGKPMIAYSIDAAKATGLFKRIIVSTDDAEIADVARSCGAEVPFVRPEELADDFVGTADVVNHCVAWLQEDGEEFDFVCCLYATAPFIQSGYIRQGYDLVQEAGKPFSFSVTSFPFPIQRAVMIENGEVKPFYPEQMKTRSQDLVEAWHDAGQFYWNRVDVSSEDAARFPAGARPVVLPRYLVQDIDTVEDWERAEVMYEVLLKRGQIK